MHALQPTDEFLEAAHALGIAFDPGDLDRLGAYLAALQSASEQVNLTAITEPAAMWMRHVYDSLTLVPLLAGAHAMRIIDVGSGGGLPGVVLAIAMPDVQLTLLEATGKKARFLREVCSGEAMGRPRFMNVHVVNERAETLGRDPDHREQYDVAVARAVGKLPVLLELTSPLVRVGGHIFAIKGERAHEEIASARSALHALHCRVADTRRTPTGTIIVIDKPRKTPRAYPRRPGDPKRSPL